MSPSTLKDSEPENLMTECVRCGSCKAVCPTYAEDASEGMSARGRVVLMEKFRCGELSPSKKLEDALFSCVLCGACNKLCPLGVSVTDAIYDARVRLSESNKKRRFLNFIAKVGFKRTSEAFKILKFIETMGEILPIFKVKPFKTIRTMGLRFPDAALKDGMSIFKVSRPKGRIAVFAGCAANFIYPGTATALIESLNAMNYEVVLPKGEVCCGAPLMGLGLKEDAAEMADRNVKNFKKLNVEAVIGLCPTCVHFIKNEYKKLVGESIDIAMEISQFLSSELVSSKLKAPQTGLRKNSKLRVVYHDPCHSLYNLNIRPEPREILRSIGFNVVDSSGGCCGFGGAFRLLYQGLSEGILEQRIEDYKNADVIVTSCPNCVLQLRSKIKDKPVRHIAEVIREAMKGDRR
ncbi:MAG TPA: hypothetical protein DHV16_07540 [Nitrospiraceae bacterium]|nr:hypothetical protein [Nitrospiraceae bacterium]